MNKTKKLALQGIFLALLVVSAKVSLPVIPPVPFTLQTAVVILCGIVLGWQSAFTILIYITMGLLGLPVFAMGGGIGYVLTPTFGFTLGFLCSAPLVGVLYSRSKSIKNAIFSVSLGTITTYIVGIGYYLLLKNFYFGETVDLWKTFLTFYIMFIPSDVIKGAICIAVARRLQSLHLVTSVAKRGNKNIPPTN